MKFGNLNFLESSGPLKACNGTALLLILPTEGIYDVWISERKSDYSFPCIALNDGFL